MKVYGTATRVEDYEMGWTTIVVEKIFATKEDALKELPNAMVITEEEIGKTESALEEGKIKEIDFIIEFEVR